MLLFLLRRPLPFAFVGRGQPDLAARVSRTYGFLCLYVVGDGVSTAFGGAILGAGKQGVAGVVVVLAYFAVALPIAYLLALRQGYGFMGCVAAMTLGTFLQCAGNGWVTGERALGHVWFVCLEPARTFRASQTSTDSLH